MFHADFTNPNLTVTCFGNTINVKWYPVHEKYNSVEEIRERGQFLEYCNAVIKCDSGYSKKVCMYFRYLIVHMSHRRSIIQIMM